MDNKPCDKCDDTAQVLITSQGEEKKTEDSLCIECASVQLLPPGIQLRSDGTLLLSDKSGNTNIISSDNANYARLMVFYNIYTNSKAPDEKVIAARHQTMWRLDLEWDVYLQKTNTGHNRETSQGKEGKEKQQQGGGAKQARKKKKKKQENKSSRVLLIINIMKGENKCVPSITHTKADTGGGRKKGKKAREKDTQSSLHLTTWINDNADAKSFHLTVNKKHLPLEVQSKDGVLELAQRIQPANKKQSKQLSAAIRKQLQEAGSIKKIKVCGMMVKTILQRLLLLSK